MATLATSPVRVLAGALLLNGLLLSGPAVLGDEHPLPAKDRDEMKQSLLKEVERLSGAIQEQPGEVSLYSNRGDQLFFLADFKGAVADYEKMVALDPDQDASHWRRGIAWFYAGDFENAARQFEKYHSFDDVDRENGIWRYFSQYRAYGAKKAQEGLLKYRKTDREPFPSVYRLFQKELTPEAILKLVADADIPDDERVQRGFYAELYVGLNDALEGRDEAALIHLRAATASEWGPQASYGPRYMWHVGRLHYELLRQKKPVSK